MADTSVKTQKELFVMDKTLHTEIRETPIPQPSDDQVVIRVVAASSNPLDWKYVASFGRAGYQGAGDDMAGYIHAVGKNVYEFKPGDRVCAFHVMGTPHGAYAEYAIAESNTTFFISPKTSFEEAATFPMSCMTAAVAMYQDLDLPTPWRPRKDSDPELPFIIYGGSSGVGGFALKLAKLSNIHPLITVCSKGQPFVESTKAADHIIKYRETKDVAAALKSALGDKKCFHAFDTVSFPDTFKAACAALSPNGKVITLLPTPPAPPGINHIISMVGNVHKRDPSTFLPGIPECGNAIDFGYIFYRYIGYLLAQSRISGHPYKVMGGLDKVEEGMKLMQAGKLSASKLMYLIAKE
ncbi:chaperonin 10-like protein [Phlyctochytrium arcticum]|nr:chaperonin 10-like protein [Phlyctochytrium arcticum]